MAHIMAVDDSVSLRQLLVRTLIEGGHRVLEAKDGVEALGAAATQKFQLVITDVNMPQMDGLTLVKKLRELPAYKHIPILVLTTEMDPNKKKIAKDAGATGWIVKPFEPVQLLATIRKVLDYRGLMSSLNDLKSQLLGAFFEESAEAAELLEAGLLKLEAGFDAALVDEVFRAAHSIKGGAGTFGFAEVGALAHDMETLLDQIRAGTRPPTPEMMALLLEGVDALGDALAARREGRAVAADAQAALRRTLQVMSASPVAAATAPEGFGDLVGPCRARRAGGGSRFARARTCSSRATSPGAWCASSKAWAM